MDKSQEKPHKIAQLYGYSVCLVAVITFLISLSGMVGALFDLSNPLHAGWYQGPNMASFETYKMDLLRSQGQGDEKSIPGYVPDDETLRSMYEAAKSDRIQRVGFQARRALTSHGLLLIVCLTLFSGHWVWIRKRLRVEVPATA